MDSENGVLRLSLKRKKIQVILEDENGVEGKYTLSELSGTERNSYLNKMTGRVKVDKNGQMTGIKSFDGFQADLLTLSLYDDEGTKVTKDFVESLPQGYDTWVGQEGLRLSGGERQRLAIARAILKQAPILLLDEPTANLDALTEREVMAALQSLMVGRTSLVVTHRLMGLEEVDEILVLRDGRVVERGRHHDLVQMGGLYRRMWDLQRQTLVFE